MLRSLLLSYVLYTGTGFGIENSIIGDLDSQFYIKNHKNKFSDKQYEELIDTLQASCQFRVMSYNVLSKYYDRLQKEDNVWEKRKDRVIALIQHDNPDILCCQELTVEQISEMQSALEKDYAIYAPLPGGEEKYQTELLGIFYKKTRFDFIKGGMEELGCSHFSEELQSFCYQYFIKGFFKDRFSGKEFVAYNTHADYLKPNGRIELVDFLLQDAEKEALVYPTMILGDFNTLPSALPNQYEHPALPGLDGSYVLQKMTKKSFRNSLDLPLIAHVGPHSTYTYKIDKQAPFTGVEYFGLLLDHIFVTPSTIKVIFHAHEPATVDNHFPSDHLPVIADLAIP